ncbi:hypothetical protein ASE00_17255 [Sphingomonas sp. Root710]|uniref:hypothetical protein n=1 Tax=Sphingomonas sp. Root710 TaxID=1736594 RepID=UPI0006F30DB1|nr:hypothetical protein [Sphingomonas sp. Root710]KRB80773.1 hypothetical protein ASE00_17255 [Sphingomonas sp. Root710]
MTEEQKAVALACLRGAEDDSIAFPDGVGRLLAAGFERYAIDYARATAFYYLPSGESVELSANRIDAVIGERLDVIALRAAITEAQANGPDYSYARFSMKAMTAGCAGYLVSFSGRRALYWGRTGETHVEHFPD